MLSVRGCFPDFRLTACVSRSPRRAFRTITRDSFPGKWIIYFFWPKDFTPICHTELTAFASLVDDFAERDAVVLGCSVDSEFVHLAWNRGSTAPGDDVPIFMLSDVRRELTQSLNIIDPEEGVALRATFIVDPGFTIRHASMNDFSVGRNPREILRILDALQTDELCPSNWERGQPTIASATAHIESLIVESVR